MLTEHIVNVGSESYLLTELQEVAVTEPVVLFANQMAPRNWAYILLAFTLAIPFLMLDGVDILLALQVSAGLAITACLLAVGLIAFMGRRNVGLLRLRDGRLEAEMLSPFGSGRQVIIPLDQVGDWRLTRRWPTLRFRYGRQDFNLPLHGAGINWSAIKQIAPEIRDIPR